MKVKQMGNLEKDKRWNNPQIGRVYGIDGLCPTLNTVGGWSGGESFGKNNSCKQGTK